MISITLLSNWSTT